MTPQALLTVSLTDERDVSLWFAAHVEAGINFHPDTRGAEYVNADQSNVFSTSEAWQYDGLMQRAFDVCERAHVDIYRLALDAHIESYRLKP